jgi:hypothetical protein
MSTSPEGGRIPLPEKGPRLHQAKQREVNTSHVETTSLYSQRQHYPPYNDIHSLPHHYMPYLGSSTTPPSYSMDSYSGSQPRRFPTYNNLGQGPPLPLSHYYTPYPVEPLEFIHDPQPCDGKRPQKSVSNNKQAPEVLTVITYCNSLVLSGRGGATNSHSGNRAFRTLVKQYQTQYLKAKKRDKPAVAAIVVEKIRATGGRFLRRHHVTSNGVVWVEIGDEKAREKTCQALRGTAEFSQFKIGNVHDCSCPHFA